MKKNILIVEDTTAIREEISDILKMEGFEVSEAENGQEGVEIAQKTNPNLIIADVLMPEVSGFELSKILGHNIKTKNIPVVFLSAKANKETVEKGKSLGCGEFIIKPVTPDALLKVVYNRINK